MIDSSCRLLKIMLAENHVLVGEIWHIFACLQLTRLFLDIYTIIVLHFDMIRNGIVYELLARSDDCL